MKNETDEASPEITPSVWQADTTKLLSLLALAAGATAMPQTVQADIIYTDLTSSPMTVGAHGDFIFLLDNMPGVARLGFQLHSASTLVSYSRWVTAGQKAGYVRLKTNAYYVIPLPAGVSWNGHVGTPYSYGTVGWGNDQGGHGPNSYSNRYLSFKFKDSTQGNADRYGWVQISLSNPTDGSGPDVTIFGYAYDTSGATIATGQVPEPSSAALLALGALAFGAKGLRSWRRNRAASTT